MKFPEEYCYSGFGEEARAIRGRYGSDVSLLAEALCPPEEDPRPTDEALGRHDEAVLDAAWIGHARHTLEDWMAALTTAGGGPVANLTGDRTANLREFLAVPLVTGEHFEQHLSALTFHLLTGRYGPEMAGTILANRQRAILNDTQAGQWVHASSSPGGGAGDGRLSPMGECCLARHLETDYRLIATMLGDGGEEWPGGARRDGPPVAPVGGAHPAVSKACDWGDGGHREACRSDLRSMLARRGAYLDAAGGSCGRVVLGREAGGSGDGGQGVDRGVARGCSGAI